MDSFTNVTAASASQLPCRIHPQVILSILDYKIRHNEHAIAGPLLGFVSEGSVIEVTDCFLADHQYNSEGQTGHFNVVKDEIVEMLELKSRINEKETVVGWFSSEQFLDTRVGAFLSWVNSKDGIFSAQQHLSSPLYLMIDASLSKKATLPIKMYSLNSSSTVAEPTFASVPFELNRLSEDPSTLMMITRARRTTQGNAEREAESHAENISAASAPLTIPAALDDLEKLLVLAKNQVESVIAGKTEANSDAARLLFKALGSSLIEPSKFQALVDASIKDAATLEELSAVCEVQAQLLASVATYTSTAAAPKVATTFQ